MNAEDKEIETLLQDYLTRLRNNKLTVPEKMSLINLYVQATQSPKQHFTEDKIKEYIFLGWYVSQHL